MSFHKMLSNRTFHVGITELFFTTARASILYCAYRGRNHETVRLCGTERLQLYDSLFREMCFTFTRHKMGFSYIYKKKKINHEHCNDLIAYECKTSDERNITLNPTY